jgi:hypothetical protein
MFSSVLHSSANKNALHQPPSAPAAFVSKKNAFAPPPVRYADPPTPQQQPEEEEAQGEWAMALYDYNSSVNCYVSARSFLLANDVFVYRTLEIYVSGRISGCWLQSGLQMIGTSL